MKNDLLTRALVVVACMLTGAGLIARSSTGEVLPPRAPLADFPLALGSWRGQAAPDFDDETVRISGVDEYLNRMYYAPARAPLNFYVGYYESQRQGDTMHSPLNCLPGAGWIPIDQRRIQIPVRERGGDRQIEVNSFVIEKGLDRQNVIYWYQSHGRVVASEYWGKVFMVVDSMRLNRTDGAMVRVIVPVGRGEDAPASAAEATAVTFIKEMFPLLSTYLPS